MGELLNRSVQRGLLETLAAYYPESADNHQIQAVFSEPENQLNVNLVYLEEHGPIAARRYSSDDVECPFPAIAKITAKGLDFLADDGGLSAILGTVTVRFHDDTIRQLLIEKVEEDSDADHSMKSELKKAIRALPAESLKQISAKSVEHGIRSLPSAIQYISQFINGGS